MTFQIPIIAQGDVTHAIPGHYTSFPSLFQDPASGDIILVYRRGVYDDTDARPGMSAHGLEGNLYWRRFDEASLQFGDEMLLCDGAHYPPGLIDGNITVADGRVHLFVRRYPHPQPVFYSQGSSFLDLSQPDPVPVDPGFYMGAQWGRLVSLHGGKTLLQAFYGGDVALMNRGEFPQYYTRPALYRSNDGGTTWAMQGWMTPEYLEDRLCGNETTLVNIQRRLYAVMRCAGESPGPLFMTTSDDEGETWSQPVRTGLYGEAPMFYQAPDGTVLLGFRGYREASPKEGGTFSLTRFDPVTMQFASPVVIETYLGNHYDGGYGDLIWLPGRQQLLVSYYFSNTPVPRNPWIRFAVLALGQT